MDTTAVVALVVAVLSSVVSIIGLLIERRGRDAALEDAAKKWRAEESLLAVREKFRLEYENRAAIYGPVLRTLGAVRDVPDPVERNHYRELDEHRETLTATAQELLEHLYGKPGVFMHMDTRNALLGAYTACFEFQARRLDRTALVSAFFWARRQLRHDMEMKDGEERKG